MRTRLLLLVCMLVCITACQNEGMIEETETQSTQTKALPLAGTYNFHYQYTDEEKSLFFSPQGGTTEIYVITERNKTIDVGLNVDDKKPYKSHADIRVDHYEGYYGGAVFNECRITIKVPPSRESHLDKLTVTESSGKKIEFKIIQAPELFDLDAEYSPDITLVNFPAKGGKKQLFIKSGGLITENLRNPDMYYQSTINISPVYGNLWVVEIIVPANPNTCTQKGIVSLQNRNKGLDVYIEQDLHEDIPSLEFGDEINDRTTMAFPAEGGTQELYIVNVYGIEEYKYHPDYYSKAVVEFDDNNRCGTTTLVRITLPPNDNSNEQKGIVYLVELETGDPIAIFLEQDVAY